MAGIEDIILRTTSNPPLTTKGSELTWVELDNNFIKIYNALVAQYISSYIPAYDGGATYDDVVNNYAFYGNKIYKWQNAIAGNTTPGTGGDWSVVWAAELAHRKNSDTILDEGGDNEVTAETINEVLAGDHIFPYIIIKDNGSPQHKWKFTVDTTGMLSSPGEDLGEV